MTRRLVPLPAELRSHGFSVADAVELGVTRARLRARDLDSPFHGTRAAAGTCDTRELCLTRASRLPPFAAVSHTTAAILHGLPLPLALQRQETLHFSVPVGKRAPAGRGTTGHQVICDPSEADRRHGVLCTTPARTFCDLASVLDLAALVAVGDALLHRRLATAAEIGAVIDRHASRRGRPRLLRAFALLDGRSRSPKESEIRVRLVEFGYDAPEVNFTVRDATGRFVAEVDLAYPRLRVALEYEGDHHREPHQWRRDIQRRRRLEAMGWLILSATQADLDDMGPLLADLDAALATRS